MAMGLGTTGVQTMTFSFARQKLLHRLHKISGQMDLVDYGCLDLMCSGN